MRSRYRGFVVRCASGLGNIVGGFRDSFPGRIVVMLSLPIVVSTTVREKGGTENTGGSGDSACHDPASVSIAANGITSRNNKLFNIELFKNRRRPHKLPLLSSYTSRFTDYLILRMINIPCTASNSSFPSGGGHLLFDGNPCGGKQKRRSVLPLKPFGGGIPESAPRFLDPCLKLLRPAIRGGAAS